MYEFLSLYKTARTWHIKESDRFAYLILFVGSIVFALLFLLLLHFLNVYVLHWDSIILVILQIVIGLVVIDLFLEVVGLVIRKAVEKVYDYATLKQQLTDLKTNDILPLKKNIEDSLKKMSEVSNDFLEKIKEIHTAKTIISLLNLKGINVDSFENVLTNLKDSDYLKNFYANAKLWEFMGFLKDVPTHFVVVRDKYDCLTEKGEIDYSKLSTYKQSDWTELFNAIESKYSTVIHNDLQVWEGLEGYNYFNSNLDFVNKKGIESLRRIFIYPHLPDFETKIKTLTQLLQPGTLAGYLKKVAEMMLAYKNRGEIIDATKGILSGIADDQKEKIFDHYYDLLLFMWVVKSHEVHRLSYRVLYDSGNVFIRNVKKGLLPPIYKGEIHSSSAALLDDKFLINVKIEKDECIVHYFTKNGDVVRAFKSAFENVFNPHPPLNKLVFVGHKEVKDFLKQFSSEVVNMYDDIGPIVQEQ